MATALWQCDGCDRTVLHTASSDGPLEFENSAWFDESGKDWLGVPVDNAVECGTKQLTASKCKSGDQSAKFRGMECNGCAQVIGLWYKNSESLDSCLYIKRARVNKVVLPVGRNAATKGVRVFDDSFQHAPLSAIEAQFEQVVLNEAQRQAQLKAVVAGGASESDSTQEVLEEVDRRIRYQKSQIEVREKSLKRKVDEALETELSKVKYAILALNDRLTTLMSDLVQEEGEDEDDSIVATKKKPKLSEKDMNVYSDGKENEELAVAL